MRIKESHKSVYPSIIMGAPKINRVGQRHGKLVIVKNLIPSDGEKNYGGVWLCQCDCGKTKEIRGYWLASTNSCGCAVGEGNKKARITRRKNRFERCKEVTLKAQYRSHKASAKQKGYGEGLPYETWLSIVLKSCHYCGSFDKRNVTSTKEYQTRLAQQDPLPQEQIDAYEVQMNGIDRVDSSQGYTVENSVPCCERCNRMKLFYSVDGFLNHVKHIYEFQASKSMGVNDCGKLTAA